MKRKEELCHELREFISATGLAENRVPSMKELCENGRSVSLRLPFYLLRPSFLKKNCYFFSFVWLVLKNCIMWIIRWRLLSFLCFLCYTSTLPSKSYVFCIIDQSQANLEGLKYEILCECEPYLGCFFSEVLTVAYLIKILCFLLISYELKDVWNLDVHLS